MTKVNVGLGALFALVVALDVRAGDIVPPLPRPVTNNVVASVRIAGELYVVSLLGLGSRKTWRDVRSDGFVLRVGLPAWQPLPSVPDGQGRLAAAMVAVGERMLVIGGYTVAKDGTEVSTPQVYALDVVQRTYQQLTNIPTPVDDAVALVYRDRYVYLVSGWHDDGNVALVQRYDVLEDRWVDATPFPGAPVFGHAGAIAGNVLVVCDGVRVTEQQGKRRFEPSPECWRGVIDEQAPENIAWKQIAQHPGPARYRMAAAALGDRAALLFVGGSANPYNYDAIGYDSQPSEPEVGALVYDVDTGLWRRQATPVATMDTRGLVMVGGNVLVIGGMRAGQRVESTVVPVAETPSSRQ
jgi:N-acetylneuraminic acid mutarotase